MLIELEPAKPNFERVWADGGFDDFVWAVKQFAATHASCGAAGSTEDPVTVYEHEDEPLGEAAPDGIRRVWIYCACGRQQLVLGPPAGGDRPPLFPRLQ